MDTNPDEHGVVACPECKTLVGKDQVHRCPNPKQRDLGAEIDELARKLDGFRVLCHLAVGIKGDDGWPFDLAASVDGLSERMAALEKDSHPPREAPDLDAHWRAMWAQVSDPDFCVKPDEPEVQRIARGVAEEVFLDRVSAINTRSAVEVEKAHGNWIAQMAREATLEEAARVCLKPEGVYIADEVPLRKTLAARIRTLKSSPASSGGAVTGNTATGCKPASSVEAGKAVLKDAVHAARDLMGENERLRRELEEAKKENETHWKSHAAERKVRDILADQKAKAENERDEIRSRLEAAESVIDDLRAFFNGTCAVGSAGCDSVRRTLSRLQPGGKEQGK